MPINITFNPENNILLIKLKEGEVAESDAQGNAILDYNAKGELLSLELTELNVESLAKATQPIELIKN